MESVNGFAFGIDGEIVNLSQYSKGWGKLDIDSKYRNKDNYEMYCYLRYLSLDAEQMFYEKIKEFEKN